MINSEKNWVKYVILVLQKYNYIKISKKISGQADLQSLDLLLGKKKTVEKFTVKMSPHLYY